MKAVLERLTASADHVVFDSPPLGAVTDAAILASLVDGTVLVIDAAQTRRVAVARGTDSLARVGANVLGVTLNFVRRADVAEAYGYGFGPGPDDWDTASVIPSSERHPSGPSPSSGRVGGG
jgi:Mrp family chromosome partitioning ATPase